MIPILEIARPSVRYEELEHTELLIPGTAWEVNLQMLSSRQLEQANMPYQSRWTLTVPPVALPEFMFGAYKGPDLPNHKKLLIDAKRPDSHFFTLVSYHAWCQRFAAGLHAAGFRAGDRLMLYSGNSIFTPIVVMGTIMAQGVYNSASPGFSERELEHQIRNCEPKLILAAESCFEQAQKVAKRLGYDSSAVLLFNDIAMTMLDSPSVIQDSHWARLLRNTTDDASNVIHNKSDPQDTCILVYSSGTTGLPKGVEISHRQIVSNILQLQQCLCSDQSITDRRTLCALPFYHGLGLLYFCLMAPKIGMQAVLMDHYETLAVMRHISDFAITELLLVPPMVLSLAKCPPERRKAYDLTSVRKVLAGAAPLGLPIMQQFEELFDGRVKVRQAWGMSEAPAICMAWDETQTDEPSSTAVGELLPGIEAVVVGDNEGEILRRGVPGELWIRGPNAMKGYWRNAEATAQTKTDDGWIKTGDVAYIDANDRWFIVDRKKELIKVRGAQVAPAELEALLLEHPQIIDAAVIGRKLSTGDEEPVAFVVRRHQRMLSGSEVVAFVNRRVSKPKRLTGGVVFLDTIPKTPSGKILRRQLRDSTTKEASPQARL